MDMLSTEPIFWTRKASRGRPGYSASACISFSARKTELHLELPQELFMLCNCLRHCQAVDRVL